jgi:hypothetical protein
LFEGDTLLFENLQSIVANPSFNLGSVPQQLKWQECSSAVQCSDKLKIVNPVDGFFDFLANKHKMPLDTVDPNPVKIQSLKGGERNWLVFTLATILKI